MKIRITIGPDDVMPGTAWLLESVDDDGFRDCIETGGTSGQPRATGGYHDGTVSVNDWLRWARRNVRARGLRIRWTIADVQPYGYSIGPGHAPHGITIETTATRSKR